MIESSVIRKISDLNNDNRNRQSLEEIENKIIKAATKGYQCIKVGVIGDYETNILKDTGYFLYRKYIKMCRSTKGSSIFFDYIKCTKNKKDIVCF